MKNKTPLARVFEGLAEYSVAVEYGSCAQAIAGDTEATKIVVGIMERVAKINGVIPDRSLVTVDQRALHLDGGEVTFSIAAASGNMAKMVYEAEKDAVGNGGGAV